MSVDPNTRRVLGAIAGAAVGVALTPVLAPAVLGIFGFGAAGPIVGVGSGIRPSTGNVTAGSMFAVAQSIAMGGAIPAVITAVGAGVGAGMGMAAAGAGLDDEDPEEDPTDAAGEDTASKDEASVDAVGPGW